ncbi:MAG: hypothetical protein HOE90_17075 [Bacteriovoracaceae bacterium]|nr:hypothetical protein [Bacteriovoracaceae bacterium]
MNRVHRIILILSLLFAVSLSAFSKPMMKKRSINYKTYFGSCPSRVVGNLTLELLSEYERTKSLRSLKKKFIREGLKEKHFLSSYKIKYNQVSNFLTFFYECPAPLLKVQVYKEEGQEGYSAILVENGELFDPTYEVLLRGEKKLKKELPVISIPLSRLDIELQKKLAYLIKLVKDKFRSKLAEMIISDDNALTIILSVRGKPSSAFLGKAEWKTKVLKLQKLISYMEKKRRVPLIINLSNSKKVVVKFSDNS